MKKSYKILSILTAFSIFIFLLSIPISLAETNKLSDSGDGALLFDGSNDFITVPHNPSFNVTTFTVECWVKFRDIETSGEDDSWGNVEQVLFSKGIDNQPNTFHFFERHVNGTYHLGLEAGYYTAGDIVISSPLNLVNDQWYHVAGSFDGNTLRVFLNGEQVGSKVIGSFTFNNTGALAFGRHPHESGNLWQFYLNGYMQEIRYWSIALSLEQIKENMYEYLDNAPNLISSWHLDNGNSQTVLDTTAGRNGYLGSTMVQDPNDPLWAATNIPVKKFRLVYPNGGEFLKSSSIVTVQWYSGNVQNVDLAYSVDNGETWQSIVEGFNASLLKYEWILPGIESSDCLVRITDSSDSTTSDTSDAAFSISEPFLRIVSPISGDIWSFGLQNQIIWESLDVEFVKIEYSIDDGVSWNLISERWNAGMGHYPWPVPFIDETDCVIRITGIDNTSLSATSSIFRIAGPNIKVTYPNGGEIIDFSIATYIEWISQGVNYVDIELSVDGGLSWMFLGKHINAVSGKFHWNPSKAVTSQLCIIRISDSDGIIEPDISDDTFLTVVSLITDVNENNPKEIKIFNNYPNPFNSSTTITYSIPDDGNVQLDIYNVQGQHIRSLVNGFVSAGKHNIIFNSTGLASGIYIASIKYEDKIQTLKMSYTK